MARTPGADLSFFMPNTLNFLIFFPLASLAINVKNILIEIGPNMQTLTYTSSVNTFHDFYPPPAPTVDKVDAAPQVLILIQRDLTSNYLICQLFNLTPFSKLLVIRATSVLIKCNKVMAHLCK